jgi:hypothetical protein
LEKFAPHTVEYDKEGQLMVPEMTYYHFAKFRGGALLMISNQQPSEGARALLRKAAIVFDLAFARFLDLQKAEVQAREASKRVSVDGVRAEIASMRTTNDLEKIIPLVWNELTTLGVPFIRCGVFIMDEEQQQVQSFLSAPDGKAIAAFRQPYNAPGETAQIIAGWQRILINWLMNI